MSARQVREIFDQGQALGSVEAVCFEGGEPFLESDLLLRGVTDASSRGWRTEAISNAFWATSPETALETLRPLVEAGLNDLLVSEDPYHGPALETLPGNAAAAAEQLGIGAGTIAIREAEASVVPPESTPGEPIKGGTVRFRGRAAAWLTRGLPRRPWDQMATCPHEELADPIRIHIDALGNAHLCQGLIMGNVFVTPLSELFEAYDPDRHPICGPLLAGGPAALARAFTLPHADAYVDECHMCYELRDALRDRFPERLGPPQMYGVVDAPPA